MSIHVVSIDAETDGRRAGRERGAAEAARFALLGLLLAGPAHGYDLSRRFTPTSALGDIIHLGPSHLYALLTRLERDGLIAGEVRDAGNRPQRRVYALTDAGRAAIEVWIDEPVTHPRDMRIDFPLKLYLAQRLSTERAHDLVDRQQTVFLGYISRLQDEHKPADTESDAAFHRLMRDARIGRARAALEWLDGCLHAGEGAS